MGMNILVAGATGKTGLHLVQELVDQGHKPTALVRESSDTARCLRALTCARVISQTCRTACATGWTRSFSRQAPAETQAPR